MKEGTKTQSKPHKKTKRDQLIVLLGRKRSLTIEALSKTLSWQPHTTRAAISRLRSAGLNVETIEAAKGQPSRYCLMIKQSVNNDPIVASVW